MVTPLADANCRRHTAAKTCVAASNAIAGPLPIATKRMPDRLGPLDVRGGRPSMTYAIVHDSEATRQAILADLAHEFAKP